MKRYAWIIIAILDLGVLMGILGYALMLMWAAAGGAS